MGERTRTHYNFEFTTRHEPLHRSVCCVPCGKKFHTAPPSHSQISPFFSRLPFTPASSPEGIQLGWLGRSLARSRLRQCPVHSPQFPQPANPSQPSSTLPFPALPRLTSLPRFAPTVPRKAADHGMTISLPFLSLPSFFLWAKPCLQVVLM